MTENNYTTSNYFAVLGRTHHFGEALAGYRTAVATPQRQILFSSACRRWVYHSSQASAYDITMIGDLVVTSWDMVNLWRHNYNAHHEDRHVLNDRQAPAIMMDQLAYQMSSEYVSATALIAHYVNTDDEEQLAAPNDLAELV